MIKTFARNQAKKKKTTIILLILCELFLTFRQSWMKLTKSRIWAVLNCPEAQLCNEKNLKSCWSQRVSAYMDSGIGSQNVLAVHASGNTSTWRKQIHQIAVRYTRVHRCCSYRCTFFQMCSLDWRVQQQAQTAITEGRVYNPIHQNNELKRHRCSSNLFELLATYNRLLQ